jgi:hypothetical protein
VSDLYEPIKKFLPVRSRIAFVFKDNKKDIVFYTEGHSPFVRSAYYDGTSLVFNNPALDAMMDDGLTYSGRQASGSFDRMQLFWNQFKPMNHTDRLLAEIFTGKSTEQGRTNMWKIAVGVEVVFAKPSSLSDSIISFDQKDCVVGDEIVRLMIEYPYKKGLAEDAEFIFENCKIVLKRVGDLLEKAPRSEMVRRFVGQTWLSLRENMEVVEYQEELAPLFIRVKEASRAILLS